VTRGTTPLKAGQPIEATLLARQFEISVPCEAADWTTLETHIRELCSRYEIDLGDNAYAALNAMTDFASRPPDNRHLRRDRHSLQRLAGSWLTSFGKECRQPDFAIDSYLATMVEPKRIPN
jgi:hypothetical protein